MTKSFFSSLLRVVLVFSVALVLIPASFDAAASGGEQTVRRGAGCHAAGIKPGNQGTDQGGESALLHRLFGVRPRFRDYCRIVRKLADERFGAPARSGRDDARGLAGPRQYARRQPAIGNDFGAAPCE